MTLFQRITLFPWSFFNKIVNLTKRFHVAVLLFSKRSQIMSKCGKNMKSGTPAIAEYVADVITTLRCLVLLLSKHYNNLNMESIYFI